MNSRAPFPKQLQVLNWVIVGLVVLLPFERLPSIDVQFIGLASITLRLSLIAGALLILGAITTWLPGKRRPIPWPWWSLGAFIGLAFVSAALSAHPAEAYLKATFLLFVAMVALSIHSFFEPAYSRSVKVAILVTTVLIALFALYQFFGDTLGLSTSLTGLRARYTKAVFGFPRIQAASLEPLYLANYLLIPAALAALLAVFKSRRFLWLFWLFSTCILLTLSRGGIIALALATVLLFGYAAFNLGWRRALAIPAIMIVSLVTTFAIIAVGSKVDASKKTSIESSAVRYTHQLSNFGEGESVVSRSETRELATNAFKSHPLLGVGPGQFGAYALQARPQHFKNSQAIVNNEPLELLAENGILGFLSFVLFAVGLLAAALKRLPPRSPQISTRDLLLVALLVGLIGIAVQYLSFSTLYIMDVWTWIGLLSALVYTKQKGRLE